jgi:transcriptional regulator with XRE-family HTH domain
MGSLKANFGSRLRQLRLRAELTQSELSERVGVTPETISNIERGKYGPQFATVERLADALNVSAQALFDFDAI